MMIWFYELFLLMQLFRIHHSFNHTKPFLISSALALLLRSNCVYNCMECRQFPLFAFISAFSVG